MNKCKICKVEVADKTGSHIVPHFLIKRIENIDGKMGRGYELGFKITDVDVNHYFGSSVLPERLEAVLGSIRDEDIEHNKHPLIVDFIFCTKCENRLAVLESIYSEVLFGGKNESGRAEIGILFWMSVFWRISICESFSFSMTHEDYEICRRILDRNLKLERDALEIDSMGEYLDFKKVSYKVFRCEGYSNTHPTSLYLVPKIRKPYILLVDEFIVCFSLKNKYHEYKTANLWNIIDDLSAFQENTINLNETVIALTAEKMSIIYKGLANEASKQKLGFISDYLDRIHVEFGGKGREMYPELKKSIMTEIAESDEPLGRRYTAEHIRDCAVTVFKREGLL